MPKKSPEDRLDALEKQLLDAKEEFQRRLNHLDDELKIAFSDISGTFKYLMERLGANPEDEPEKSIIIKD